MSFCVINCTNQFTNASGITFLDFLKVNRSRPLGSMQFVQRGRCVRVFASLPHETEVPCSLFSARDKRNLCSQPNDFPSCMRELRQHLSRETPLPVRETKRHFYFPGTACDNFEAKKLQYIDNFCFFGEFVA